MLISRCGFFKDFEAVATQAEARKIILDGVTLSVDEVECIPAKVEQWFRVAGEGYDLIDKARS